MGGISSRAAVAVLFGLLASPVAAAGPPQPSCWFVFYRWVYYESTGGAGDFAYYPISGFGTTMVVTEGGEPPHAVKRKLEDEAIAALPHKPGLPAGAARVTKTEPVVCPKDWPRIPGTPPALLDRPRY